MLYTTTLNEIENNINTGVEYEIALFAKLLEFKNIEFEQICNSINRRYDSSKIKQIMRYTNISQIMNSLKIRDYQLIDVSFETQNDSVGPSDIVLIVKDKNGNKISLGLSVKYNNTCTLNVTGKNFISDKQINHLKVLLPEYTKKYIEEMTIKYGDVNNWFRMRKPSSTTDEYIDLIRDAVIENWPNVVNKTKLLSALFHNDSPIEFWVVTYTNNGYDLKTTPHTIDMKRAPEVKVRKYQTSFVAFYLDDRKIGHMQVKFNNGFVEKCKKMNPDIVCQGVEMSYGKPFSSWNFSVEK